VVSGEDARRAELLQAMTMQFFEEQEAAAEDGEVGEDAEESEEAGKVAARARSTRRTRRARLPLGRVLFSLILLAALIVPFFVDADPVALDADDIPGAVQGMSALVDGLAVSSRPKRVLVAFEYGTAEAGELDPAARVVLEHVAGSGGELVLLTTNPTGVIVGRRVVDETGAAGVTDLGYLAGFLGGLRTLTGEDPAQFSLDYGGEDSGLDIASIRADFSMIVVLTGRYEPLRAWLEQVNSVTGVEDEDEPLPPVPMVAVVSAGIEPAASAYYESGQLGGYVAGYADTVAYAQATGAALPFEDAASRHNSVTAGILAAVAVIVLVNLWYGLRAALRRRRGR
jgi:hypothetical protein